MLRMFDAKAAVRGPVRRELDPVSHCPHDAVEQESQHDDGDTRRQSLAAQCGLGEPGHDVVAERAGLDVARWEKDVKAADFTTLAKEHAEAVRRGVFGVPTLTWLEGRSYYLKITDLIPADRAVPLYDAIETVHRFGEVIEIKTPESEGTLAA